ncbi:MAG TPA: FMN-binding protein [Candidatus Paceibacterota bacterium]|nr:FMN-binding protein [Candidatus Paceibacterota bacterium]
MKRFALSVLVFVASGAYVVYQYMGGSFASAAIPAPTVVAVQTTQPVATTPATTVTTQPSTPTQTTTPTSTQTPTPTQVPTPTPTPVVTPTPAPVVKPKGLYTDGTYTGSTADAYYGTVQVQVVIQNGKIVTVNFLQYPSDRRTSQYINAQAMPQLKSEAIAAQSANVSGVSGASDTSAAFIQSLGDALTQAKNA